MHNIKKIIAEFDKAQAQLNALGEQLALYRAEADVPGREGKALTEAENWILNQITQQTDPAFQCDVLRAVDIADAMYRIDPVNGAKINPRRAGHFMRKIGRFITLRMTKGTATYRVWVLRNFQDYTAFPGSILYEKYTEQLEHFEVDKLESFFGGADDQDDDEKPAPTSFM